MANGESRVLAVIPARGGSKGIARKNLQRVGGVPLIGRAIRLAQDVSAIQSVCVSTDDPEIAQAAVDFGATVLDRPAELASDTARSEDALLHAIEALADRGEKFDVLVFLQATSPFVAPESVAEAVDAVSSGSADVAMAVTPSDAFLWKHTASGFDAVNHTLDARPRRQDREQEYRETGAFYVLAIPGFMAARFRFFGTVVPVLVPEGTSLEIDTPEQLELAQSLASTVDVPPDSIDVEAVVMDFDGVHTDDRVWVDQDGHEAVTVSRADGMGIASLHRAGVPMLILSSEINPVVAARAKKLGVEVLHGVEEKLPVLTAWAHERGLNLAEIAYVGNDVNDLECLEAVGVPVAVADARPEVLRAARIVLSAGGGQGAIRELSGRVVRSR